MTSSTRGPESGSRGRASRSGWAPPSRGSTNDAAWVGDERHPPRVLHCRHRCDPAHRARRSCRPERRRRDRDRRRRIGRATPRPGPRATSRASMGVGSSIGMRRERAASAPRCRCSARQSRRSGRHGSSARSPASSSTSWVGRQHGTRRSCSGIRTRAPSRSPMWPMARSASSPSSTARSPSRRRGRSSSATHRQRICEQLDALRAPAGG